MRTLIFGDSNFVPVQNLVRHLRGAGVEVAVVGFGGLDFPADVETRRWRRSSRLGLLTGKRAARELIEQIDPDVVHAFYLTSYGYLVSGVVDRPRIVTAMGTDVFGAPDLSPALAPLRHWLARSALRGPDRVHSVADHMTDRLVELGADPAKIVTFPRGVDLNRFEPSERPPGSPPFRLLCTRKLEPVYDHETLVRGVAEYRARGGRFALTLVGEGHLRAGLEQLVHSLDLDAEVEFVGQVAHDSMPRVFAEAEVFLSASRSDGTSSCLLESMASGCVPVTSDIAANRAWLRHGENGFLHRPGDPTSLADALTEATSEPSRWERIRTENRRLVERRGSLSQGHERILAIYRDLTSARDGEA